MVTSLRIEEYIILDRKPTPFPEIEEYSIPARFADTVISAQIQKSFPSSAPQYYCTLQGLNLKIWLNIQHDRLTDYSRSPGIKHPAYIKILEDINAAIKEGQL